MANLDSTLLEFKIGKTGRVTLYHEDERICWASGGGYDKLGTCLCDFIVAKFPKKDLVALAKKNTYEGALNEKGLIDGAFGFSTVEEILNDLGYKLSPLKAKTGIKRYIIVSN